MSTESAPLPDLSLLSPLLPLNAAALVRLVFNISAIIQTYLHNLQTDTLFYGIQNLSVTELVQVV